MGARKRSHAETALYVWQDGNWWIGFLEEYPDYWTQGVTREELEENLRDLLMDLTSGEIPHARRMAEMEIS